MWYNPLADYDYQILESYWMNFSKLIADKERDPIERKNTENITSAIETLYNDSEGLLRSVIEAGYFDSDTVAIDSSQIAEHLGSTRCKVTKLREGLMKDTAKLIGWI